MPDKKLTWNEFYGKLTKAGIPPHRILGLWPEYITTGNLPQGVLASSGGGGEFGKSGGGGGSFDPYPGVLMLPGAGISAPAKPTTSFNVKSTPAAGATPTPGGKTGGEILKTALQNIFNKSTRLPERSTGVGAGRIPERQASSTPSSVPSRTGIQGTIQDMLGQARADVLNKIAHPEPSGGIAGHAYRGEGGPISENVRNPITGGRLSEQTRQRIPEAPATGRIVENQYDPYAAVMKAIDASGMPAADFNYGDFTGQANAIAAQNFQPQYDALALAQQGAQQQYNLADPLVKGLYEKLTADIRAQAEQTGADYSAAAAARQAQGGQQAADIAGTYASTQQNQADLLKQLGIESAAPQTLQQGTGDSAWQQTQAGQGTQQQMDFLTSQGATNKTYQQNIANAEQTQGAVARQGLIAQLAQARNQIEQDRLGVASNQTIAASDLGLRLSDRDYARQQDMYNAAAAAQKDALDRAVQKYDIYTGQDTTQYNRAVTEAEFKLKADQVANDYAIAKAKMDASGQISFDQQSDIGKAAALAFQNGGDEGKEAFDAAINITSMPNAPRDAAGFLTALHNAAKAKYGANYKASVWTDVGTMVAKVMNYGTTSPLRLGA